MQLYNLYRSNRNTVTCRILLLRKRTHTPAHVLKFIYIYTYMYIETHTHTHTLVGFGLVLCGAYDSTADRDKINIRLINDDYIPGRRVLCCALRFVFPRQLVFFFIYYSYTYINIYFLYYCLFCRLFLTLGYCAAAFRIFYVR